MLYGFSIAYLIAPGTFDSAHVVEFVAGLPDGVKYAGKAILAAPFSYHAWNGLRHLAWDVGVGFKNPTVAKTGWAAVGATFALSAYYSFFHLDENKKW